MFRIAEKKPYFDGVFLANDKEVAEFVEMVQNRDQPVSCLYKLMPV